MDVPSTPAQKVKVLFIHQDLDVSVIVLEYACFKRVRLFKGNNFRVLITFIYLENFPQAG